jgi:hypothetical protein
METERLDACDGLALDAPTISTIKKVGSEVVGGFLVSEPMRQDHEKAVSHGQDRALLALSSDNPMGRSRKLGGFFETCHDPGHLAHDRAHRAMAFGGLAAEPRASADVVPRTDSCPGGQLLGGRKPTHLGPDVRTDDRSAISLPVKRCSLLRTESLLLTRTHVCAVVS